MDPLIIINKYTNSEINRNTALRELKTLVEQSQNRRSRIISLKLIEKLCSSERWIYNFLENLVISDNEEQVRFTSAKFLVEKFKERANPLFLWILSQENEYSSKVFFLQLLKEFDNDLTRRFLHNIINKCILKKKVTSLNENFCRKFQITLKNIEKKKSLSLFSLEGLIQILVDFHTISKLTEKFYSVYFELDPNLCCVTELDLSDIEYEVRGWKSEFKNNIRDLRDISGLNCLKLLKILNLSNNLIEDITKLEQNKSLTHLNIANNKLKDKKNLEVLKKLEKLEYINISGNEIANSIKREDLKISKQILYKKSIFQ